MSKRHKSFLKELKKYERDSAAVQFTAIAGLCNELIMELDHNDKLIAAHEAHIATLSTVLHRKQE